MIGYLKCKDTKCIIIRKPKVLKSVMFCDSKYATDKEKRKSVIFLVATLEETLLVFLSKSHRTATLSSTEAECVELSAWKK